MLIATSNEHKFSEMADIFREHRIFVSSFRDFPFVTSPEETGTTFAENAKAKAEYYSRHLHQPVLAEDSGLVVPALAGFPGIHSSRVAADDESRIRIVLDKLAGATDRNAYYVCSMLLLTETLMLDVEARCEGGIVNEPRGSGGFGYDPIFQPTGHEQTFGEMDRREKSELSHRGKASRLMIVKMKDAGLIPP